MRTTVDEATGTQDPRSRSIGQLMRDLTNDLTELMHEEIELAKAEMTEKARLAGLGAGLFGGAAVAGLIGLGTLTACFIALLALVMPVWAAALIMTAVWAIVAGALALTGRGRVRQASPPVPIQAIETTKEDIRWAKTRMRSGRT